MGSFRVPLQISNPNNGHTETVNALVDTGATFSMIPASMLKRMGVQPIARAPFVIASREVIEYETGEAALAAEGRRRTCPVIFGPENHYVMGATALEFMLLAVDPKNERLVPGEAFQPDIQLYEGPDN